MPEFEPMLIICLVLVGVLVINAALVLVLSHPDTRNQVTIFREAFRGLRSPWAAEDQSLEDLRGRVAELDKNEPDEDPQNADE
jgi:hypothetical protein